MIRFVAQSVLGLCLVLGVWSGPAAADSHADSQRLAEEAIAAFKEANPRTEIFFAKSHGYAVFPAVTKGGLILGGASGGGTVYEQGKVIGGSSVTQFTFGVQLGGMSFKEIVFFKDSAALERFKAGTLEMSGDVSSVAVITGSSNAMDFADDTAVFTLADGGLMLELSLGAQNFSFEPTP